MDPQYGKESQYGKHDGAIEAPHVFYVQHSDHTLWTTLSYMDTLISLQILCGRDGSCEVGCYNINYSDYHAHTS